MSVTEQAVVCACPVCDADIERPEGAVVNELIDCEECGSELEIASLEPFSLSEAPQEEEDWGQ